MYFKRTIFAIIVLMFTLQGCETMKGASNGMIKDIEKLRGEDGVIKKADNWVKKNLW